MKINKEIKILPVGLLLLLFTTGCYYDQVYIAPPPPIDREVSYTADIQPIWDTKGCMNCHNTGATAPELTPSVSYTNLVPDHVDLANPEQSKVITVLSSFMRGDVTANDEALILKWIEQGAKNN